MEARLFHAPGTLTGSSECRCVGRARASNRAFWFLAVRVSTATTRRAQPVAERLLNRPPQTPQNLFCGVEHGSVSSTASRQINLI